jgi:hypothetical protein
MWNVTGNWLDGPMVECFPPMPFLWSDAWILTAVAVASREKPAELWQVLAAADALDHSLPLDEELHGAFARLTASRHVEDFFGKFKIGQAVPPDVRTKLSEATDYKDAEKLLSSEVRDTTGDVGDSRNQLRYPRLTGELIREADKKYRLWRKARKAES